MNRRKTHQVRSKKKGGAAEAELDGLDNYNNSVHAGTGSMGMDKTTPSRRGTV